MTINVHRYNAYGLKNKSLIEKFMKLIFIKVIFCKTSLAILPKCVVADSCPSCTLMFSNSPSLTSIIFLIKNPLAVDRGNISPTIAGKK